MKDTRGARVLRWLGDLHQDLRYASRQLRRNPGFALTAVLTLAIGIGANTALFTIVDRLLLQALPVQAPEQLVLFNWLEGRRAMRFGMDGVRTTDAATGRGTSTSFSYPTFLRLRQANQTLTELFAFYPIDQLNVVVDRSADIASGQYVSGNYFRGLGVNALLGRTITADDDRAGAPPVATITYQYWNRRFGLDPRMIGQTVVVNKVPVTIIGVTPQGFSGALEVTQSADVTLPFAAEPSLQGAGSDLQRPAMLWVRLMGRLEPGVTREQAAASLNATMQQSMLDEWQQALAARRSTTTTDLTRTLEDASTLRAEPGGQGLMDSRRRYAQPLFVLMGCAGLVLLTACINVANLLLARGASRQKEIAMRIALGARRGRLVRQLFTESMVLAIIGCAAALPLALWGKDLLLIWRPWGGPLVLENALDWRVLGFCAAVAISTGIIFGFAPAVRITRAAQLSQMTTRSAAGASSPLARTLVVAQVSISLVLLVAAGLFVGTLRNLHSVEKGFNADNLLLFRVQPQLNGYQPTDIVALYTRLIDRIEAVPGVRSATLSRHPLLSFSRRSSGLAIEGARASDAGAHVNIVAPNFFATMEIPLLLGRTFDDRDNAAAPKVAVVNQLFAQQYFQGASPIGHRFRFAGARSGEPIEIVGMTRDAKYTDLRNPTHPTIYVPFQQDVPGQANFEVRTTGDPLALAPAVRQAVRDIDPNLPLFEVKSQRDQAQESVAKETTFARLSTLLGSIALLLAAIGLYGTLSYAVVRRTAEIGIRMALGAQRMTVVRMVLRDALVMTVIGLAIGVPAALAASRASRSVLDQVLFGLESNDPAAIGSAVAILLAVAAVAAAVPARRASRVEPLIALRTE